VHRRVTMPGCMPSSRRTAAPRPCGALRPLMPPSPPSPSRTTCVHRPPSRGTSCAGIEVRRRVASRRAPDLQVAAPGARGEAARGLGTAVASARPRTLCAWPTASRAAWEAAATRRVLGASIILGSPSPCKRLCV
jgi:hypothetical protein